MGFGVRGGDGRGLILGRPRHRRGRPRERRYENTLRTPPRGFDFGFGGGLADWPLSAWLDWLDPADAVEDSPLPDDVEAAGAEEDALLAGWLGPLDAVPLEAGAADAGGADDPLPGWLAFAG